MNAVVPEAPIEVASVGIGENGHLAFNDPPSDFETEILYIRVRLDDACRRQQVGEGVGFAHSTKFPRKRYPCQCSKS